MEKIETVIVGGGQAGLATSYHLKQRGREHIVLEAAEQAGHAWRNDRWDSFTLVTPNWTIKLPGAVYDGNDPDGFLPRAEIVAYFERYVEKYSLPVRWSTRVLEVAPLEDGRGYQVQAEGGTWQAKNVVIATGSFQKPRIPAYAREIPPGILQLHSGQYRNPGSLPEGAVLVAGSAQSGMQIAEELYQSGRTVYLSTCSAPRIPRRYRGRDIVAWLAETDFFEQPVERLPSPGARFAGNPHLSGKDGGHSLNLHHFARDGVQLFGHIAGAEDGKAIFAPDLKENLARVDRAEREILAMIDRHIGSHGIAVPQETVAELQDGYSVEEQPELDLADAGIRTLIWAIGYSFDYSLVKLPVTDADGFPLQRGGVTQYPGLYFVGMNWLTQRKSAILLGVDEDVKRIVADMTM